MNLYHNDMFDVFPNIEPQSVDLLLTDFPYGTLNKRRNEWDKIIDYDKFWHHVDIICKPNCAIVTTASQPFTSVLISTCLLYTSPSPRDKRQSRMPSSA